MIPLRYNVRSLLARRTTTAAAVLGIGLVVFVLSAALMLTAGLERTLNASGASDRALVMRMGSDNELSSGIEVPNLGILRTAPGVRVGPDGPELVGEVVMVAAMSKVGGGGLSNVQIRGVPENVYRFRPEVRFVQGQPPKPGSDEAAVGARIAGRFEGLALGQKVELRKNRWATVVGIFADGGSSFESEVWVGIETVRQAFHREGMASSARVRLESAAAFEAFAAAVEHDERLGLDAQREGEYYAKLSGKTAILITVLGSLISFFFAVGAVIGAMITMYASVSQRRREVGTLRALGFSRSAVLTAFVLEALMLAMAGGVLGVAAASALGRVQFAMLNMDSWSEIVFTFVPTPGILLTALLVSVVMGLVGGFLPALAAARLQPVQAMRD